MRSIATATTSVTAHASRTSQPSIVPLSCIVASPGSAGRIARATDARIRQNLVWAFIYNVVGIPLAAFGLLDPVLAGAAMALSSVSVLANALLLRRWRPAVIRQGGAP